MQLWYHSWKWLWSRSYQVSNISPKYMLLLTTNCVENNRHIYALGVKNKKYSPMESTNVSCLYYTNLYTRSMYSEGREHLIWQLTIIYNHHKLRIWNTLLQNVIITNLIITCTLWKQLSDRISMSALLHIKAICCLMGGISVFSLGNF